MHQSLFRCVFSALALALCSASAASQVRESWRQMFDFGTSYSSDVAGVIAAHPAGGFVVAGSTISAPTPSSLRNPLIIRINASGATMWGVEYTGDNTHGDSALAVNVAPSGAIYTASSPGFFNGADVRVVKYNSAGGVSWLGGPWGTPATEDFVSARELLIDASENVYAGCSTAGAAIGTYDMVVLSYDSAGTLRFATPIDGPQNGGDALKSIGKDSAGNIIAAGSMNGTATSASSLGMAKLNSNGVIQWTRALDHTGPATVQVLNSVVTDPALHIYACGAAGTAPASFAGVVVSYDALGNFRWIQQLPGAGNTLALRIAIDHGNNVVVVASQGNVGIVAKYDSLGNFVWSLPWSAVGYTSTTPLDVVIEPSGDITVAGIGSQAAPSTQDILVVHYDPAGDVRWKRTLDQAGRQENLGALLVQSNGRIAVTGWTQPYAVGSGYGAADTFTLELGDQSQPFCFGDGSATACPCGNASAAGGQVGCVNSNALGARLADGGEASIANDTLVLSATDVPGPALFFQGTAPMSAGLGFVFGDGLLCLGGTVTRLGIVFPTGTTSVYPGGLNPNPIHIGGMTAAGDTRHYQAWYRDAAVFCSAATFNLTQGLTVTWSL